MGRVVGRVLRAAVACVSIAVLVATGYGWWVYRDLSDGLVTSAALGEQRAAGPDDGFTALLVGVDSRTDAAGDPLPPEVLAQLRAGADEGQFHTDTIILLHVPGGDGRATAVSIPRDSFVQLADGLGRHKINSAYSRGMDAARDAGTVAERAVRDAGRRVLVDTVELLTGVTVDHFAEINLAGFVEITEAIGGVPVCLDAAVREPLSGVDLPAGPQVVSGGDALAFVRQRHGLGDGDLDRITRQQAFLAGLARTALSRGTLTDPARVDELLGAVTRYVVLDRGWDLDDLIPQLRRVSAGGISFRTIPTGRPDLRTPVDGIAVEIDEDAVRTFVADAFGEGAERERPPGPATARTTPVPLGPAATAPTATTGRPITAATLPCVE